MPLQLSIVTVEREVYTADDVDMVIVPGLEGALGILARHEPIVAALTEGVLEVVRGDTRELFAIGGGYVEVHGTQAVVMADVAERESEIDEARAEAARQRAQQLLSSSSGRAEADQALHAMRRAAVRLKVARRRRSPRAVEHR
jgi:F-type H+-transporting ATPase subunit epsilon